MKVETTVRDMRERVYHGHAVQVGMTMGVGVEYLVYLDYEADHYIVIERYTDGPTASLVSANREIQRAEVFKFQGIEADVLPNESMDMFVAAMNYATQEARTDLLRNMLVPEDTGGQGTRRTRKTS